MKRIQPILTFFLLLLIMAGSFSRFIIATEYFVMTEKFERSCENKNKPQLNCHGKCVMGKMMKHTSEEKEEAMGKQISFQPLAQPESFFQYCSRSFTNKAIKYKIDRTIGSIIDATTLIFRPPCFNVD